MIKLFNILLGLVFFISFFEGHAAPFQGTTVTGNDETEAVSQDDTIMNSDMCCDREYTQGWAQEISPQDSRARINRILSVGRDATPVPPLHPGPGQR